MFIPRHPVVENQFCSYTTVSGASTGAGGVLAYAGSVVYLVDGTTNQEPEVKSYSSVAPAAAGGQRTPFGFLMQKVKEGYHSIHPSGFFMPGDLGSSDAIAQPLYNSSGVIYGTKQVPVGVAHLGIWDTVHYMTDTPATDVIDAGDLLYVGTGSATAATDGRVTNGTALTNVASVVARVVKGASAAKSASNQANTTLFPIRIKLLI